MPDAQPPANVPNPYAFLYDDPKKRGGLLPSGNSTKQRIMIVVGGFIVLLILFIFIFSLIFGHKSGNTASLTSLAQQQTELNRVATAVTRQSRDSSTLVFASNVQYSMLTDQQSLVKYLGKHGVKLKSKTLSLTQSAATDKALASAQLAGTYDSTATALLQAQLQRYQKAVATTYKSGSSYEKAELRPLYVHTVSLLKNAPQVAATNS